MQGIGFGTAMIRHACFQCTGSWLHYFLFSSVPNIPLLKLINSHFFTISHRLCSTDPAFQV